MACVRPDTTTEATNESSKAVKPEEEEEVIPPNEELLKNFNPDMKKMDMQLYYKVTGHKLYDS